MTIIRIFRTTAFKLSALFITTFIICAAISGVYISQSSQQAIQDRFNESVLSEINELRNHYRLGGLRRLIRVVNSKAQEPGAHLFLVTDFSGNPVAGNIQTLSNSILNQADGSTIRINYEKFRTNSTRNISRQAIVRIFEIGNKGKFVIGRDISEFVYFSSTLNRALLLMLGGIIVSGIVGWLFFGRRALKRINSFSNTSRKLMSGNLDERLQITGSGDEFDRLAESLNKMLDKIQELNAGIKDVTDSIAHDLKTPLTRIRGKLESVLRKEENIDTYRETVKDTLTEADNLIKLFDALMRIARLEAGSADQELEVLRVDEIVGEIVEFYEPMVEDQDFKFNLAKLDSAEVMGSRELLSQAIINLLDNALKYGRAKDDTTNSITVSLTKTKSHAIISVADSGVGIKESDRTRVKERFVRLEKSRTRLGSGLGLSLVQAIMKLHLGELILKDNSPGLIVTMKIPINITNGNKTVKLVQTVKD